MPSSDHTEEELTVEEETETDVLAIAKLEDSDRAMPFENTPFDAAWQADRHE